MSFDVFKYRTIHDTGKAWELKKMFLEAHHDKFNENKLISLAQCYVNIERLGCRYPDKVMKQIKELTSDFETKLQERINEKKFTPSTSTSTSTSTQNSQFIDVYSKLDTIPLPNKTILPQSLDLLSKITNKHDFIQQPNSPPTIKNQKKTSPTTSLNKEFNKLNVDNSPSLIKTPKRNALLNNLLSFQQNQSNKSNESNRLSNGSMNESFEKLQKIEKLRQNLRKFKQSFPYTTFDNKDSDNYVDIIDLMFQHCSSLNVYIDCKVTQTADCLYSSTLFLEQYKVKTCIHKKKKKSKYFTHKDAFFLLTSDCVLAVRSTQKLGDKIEYELYDIHNDTTTDASSFNNKKKQNEINFNYNNNRVEAKIETIVDDLQQIENVDSKINKQQMIKEALNDFIIFVSSNLLNNDDENNFNERNSIAILTRSCTKNQCNLELELILKQSESQETNKSIDNGEEDGNIDEFNKYKCKCFINKVKISVSHGKTKQDAKRIAALRALKTLEKLFPILKEESKGDHNNNNNNSGETNEINENMEIEEVKWRPIKITKNDVINSVYPELEDNNELNKFSSSKFGNNYLKKWGWKGEGHGIGKSSQGIAEPVYFQLYSYRQGLGSSELVPYSYADNYLNDQESSMINVNIANLKEKVTILKNLRTFFQNYLHSKCLSELEFESCFNNEERKLIHQEAHHIGLKTQSVGIGDGRYITINKKRSPLDILEEVQKNSGKFGKYKLINNK